MPSAASWYTSESQLTAAHAKVRASFSAGKTLPLKYRLEQLKALARFLTEHKQPLIDVLVADGKCRAEAEVADIISTQKEAHAFISCLGQWVKPVSRSLDWVSTVSLDAATIRAEPLGAVLVIGTWNYPVNTALSPLIGAIGAGNTAVLKLSEVAENTARYLTQHLPAYLDPECYVVVNGAVPESTRLLALKWDHIFYTGNGTVGRVVARAAAEHLTTCTLELGGKSPSVIDRGVDLAVTARRIAFGKFLNCGQTCIATDYVLVPTELAEQFVGQLSAALASFYEGLGGKDLQQSESYGRIVSDRHWQRLDKLLKATKGTVAIGGARNGPARFIEPTVVTGVKPTDSLMQSEIFGPILPVLVYDKFEEALEFIRARDKPLAAYLFSKSRANVELFQSTISAGGLVINDTVMHYVTWNVPFGGVGESGYGKYHGKDSFDVFSHQKPVLWRTSHMEFVNQIRYPPYTDNNLRLLELALLQTVRQASTKPAN